MLAPKLVLPVAWLLFLGTASGAPASDNKLVAGEPWVTVDEDGQPKTVTPVLTTIHGTPTVINAPPPDVTESVVQSTDAAQPHTTKGKGGAAFAACHNTDGKYKPFCLPKENDVYYPDSTHYITWDPSFFHPANATVRILGFYSANTTASSKSKSKSAPSRPHSKSSELPDDESEPEEPEFDQEEEEEAFSSDTFPAAWGFYQWRVEKSLLSSKKLKTANVTIRMAALPRDGSPAFWLEGPTVQLSMKKKKKKTPKTREPDATALYIALPLVMTAAFLIIVCVSVWNRGTRRIDLGDLMRASRSGGRRLKKMGRKSGRGGKGGGEVEEAIRLMGRDGGFSSGEEDQGGWRQEGKGKKRID